MRRLLSLVMVALLVPTLGHAGTRSDPELLDPAGDISPVVAGATYADLTGVWFSSTRTGSGAVDAFQIHIDTVGTPGLTDEAAYAVDWNLDPGQDSSCWGSVTVWRADPANPSPVVPPAADLTYACTDDPDMVNVGPLFVSTTGGSGSASAGFDFAGTQITVTIPLSVFTYGGSVGRYHEGAKLIDVFGQSQVIESNLAPVLADDTSCPLTSFTSTNPSPCQSRPYAIGS